MRIFKLIITLFISLSLFTTSMFAEIISTKQLMHNTNAKSNIDNFLNKQEVQEKLIMLGVSNENIQERLASLTDEELARINHKIDTLPAGAGAAGVIGVIVFIFIVLLITDILGYTKVYSFTRSVH